MTDSDSEAPPSPAFTRHGFVERAAALAPITEAEALASEEAGTLTAKVVEAFRTSELLSCFLPRELGGDEVDLASAFSIIEEIARQDGSAGWCFGMNALITGICSAALPDAGIDRIYSGKPSSVLMAGGFPPQGRADREGDGWRVSGHFRFGSGILHADHVVCTVIEFDGDAPRMDGALPQMRTLVVPAADVRVTRNWDVSGLQATGSCDYHLDDQLIPDELSFVSSTITARRGAGFYGMPLLSLVGAPHIGFALGVGRRAVEEVGTHAGWRQRLASPKPLAQRGAFQQGFARARTRLLAARAFALECFEAIERGHASASGIQLEDRVNAYASTVLAYESALEAAQYSFRAAGAGAIARANPLQRCLRDLEAGSQHILASEEGWDRIGRSWLGIEESFTF